MEWFRYTLLYFVTYWHFPTNSPNHISDHRLSLSHYFLFQPKISLRLHLYYEFICNFYKKIQDKVFVLSQSNAQFYPLTFDRNFIINILMSSLIWDIFYSKQYCKVFNKSCFKNMFIQRIIFWKINVSVSILTNYSSMQLAAKRLMAESL